MKLKYLSFLMLISFSSLKAEYPGEEIFDENCASGCHVHSSDALFKQSQRFNTKLQLAGMVSRCINATGVGIFPDDEALIVEYLNQKYYHLK